MKTDIPFLAEILTRNLKAFFIKAGKERAVVGLSGGVDSSLTAALAVRALGKENVRGLFLPHSDFSSKENLADAKEVAKQLGIEAEEKNIKPFCEALFDLPFTTKAMTKGNLMARVRMCLLYALANESDALVLGTGNKTELLTGYFTKWGDGAVDLEVLGNVWKTEVFALTEHLGLPKNVYTKPPTAELIQGQTDEGELGISYAELDSLLQKWEKEGLSGETPVEKKVLQLITASEHKRSAPLAIPRD